MSRNKKLNKGFTLIEILIVVAIIAVLASVVLIGLGPTQQAGRDARRLSDLRQVQNALELYFSKCGYYPGTYTGVNPCTAFQAVGGYGAGGTTLVSVITQSGIGVSTMPDDPTSGKHYFYAANAGGASYILATVLENANNSDFNTYTPPPVAGFTNGDAIASCAAPTYCITL